MKWKNKDIKTLRLSLFFFVIVIAFGSWMLSMPKPSIGYINPAEQLPACPYVDEYYAYVVDDPEPIPQGPPPHGETEEPPVPGSLEMLCYFPDHYKYVDRLREEASFYGLPATGEDGFFVVPLPENSSGELLDAFNVFLTTYDDFGIDGPNWEIIENSGWQAPLPLWTRLLKEIGKALLRKPRARPGWMAVDSIKAFTKLRNAGRQSFRKARKTRISSRNAPNLTTEAKCKIAKASFRAATYLACINEHGTQLGAGEHCNKVADDTADAMFPNC